MIGLKLSEEEDLVLPKNDRALNLKFKEITVNQFRMYVRTEFQ